MIAEMAAYYKKQGKSLLDVLDDMYKEHGYYSNDVISITLQGLDGKARIGRIMEEFRNNPLESLADFKTVNIVDYKLDDTGLPKSNVLKYYFEDDSWVAIRPSGTEPKIKLYINAVSKENEKVADNKKEALISGMQEIIDSVE